MDNLTMTTAPAPVSCLVPKDAADVFRFLANIENLTGWAPGYCEKVFLYREQWWAWTVSGERVIALRSHPHNQTVDWLVGESSGVARRFTMRVFPLSSGYALVTGVWAEGSARWTQISGAEAEKLSFALAGLAHAFEPAENVAGQCAI